MHRHGTRGRRKALVVFVSVSLLAALCVVQALTASAAGTVLFLNAFNNRTVDGTGTVTKPSTPSGTTNAACLTVSGNSATLPLLSCSGTADAQGAGKLRLTPVTLSQIGAVYGQSGVSTFSGVDVTFNSYQWGGNGADGISFVLVATDPANPAPPAATGPQGGSLGYSPASSSTIPGVPNGYLAVGLDVYGNFSASDVSGGTGCTPVPNITATTPGAIVVRGPGSGTAGYCGLTTTWNGTIGSKVTLHGTSRATSAVPVQVLVNPTASSYTSTTGVTVAAGTYKVVATPIGQTAKTLSGPLPAVPAGLYPSQTWLNAAGVPKNLAFGFVGSSGGLTDTHEISNVQLVTYNQVPQLGITATSYSAATSQPGGPVTYTVTASVLAGAAETYPISVALTVPTGVVPIGAYGTGWVCQAAVGKTITCTTSGSSFAAGSTLPVLTVAAIVTGTNISSTVIQTGSTATATSLDATAASDTSMTAGIRPTAPSGITVTPAIGSIAGGGTVTVGGLNIVAATAIQVGTNAEQTTATPVVLLPCAGAAAPGCFTVSGSTLVISSMPARPTIGTVLVKVVTYGIDATANYVYADRPVAPATPTAVAGAASATVTWVAPANNGSPITGYVITSYLGGVAQAPQSFDATATSRTLSGLTAGGSYTFTVSAVNAIGTSSPSTASAAVVPYTVPGAPVITAVTAASLSATLTWTAPGNGGSAITGYRVTPYIGGVAQTPQSFSGTATTRTVTGLTAGTAYTFTVAAVNVAGTGPESATSSTVTPNQSPSLGFPAPPAGEVGVAYSQQLTVTDGTSPFTWSVSSGTLPGGLTLNATTGLLSGTPTTAGTFTFTVQVVDASNQAATKAVTLVIAAVPTMTFAPAAGEVGAPYSQQPTVTGGTGPFVWTLSAGSMPAGITLNSSTGLVSGTPTASGSFSVTISATDAFNQVASRTVALVIAAQPAFGAGQPPAGQVGVAYSTTFTVTGGTAPLVWSIPAGTPPPGLTFNTSTGVLSGTPTTVGSYAFTVSVTDAFNQTASKAVTLVVAAGPLVITKTANVSSAVAGSPVAYTITIANTATSAFTGVTLNDPLTGVLDDAVYANNATTTGGTMTYTAPTLSWTGNVAAGSSVTITYSVTVNNPDVGNKVLTNTVTSTTLGTNCAGGSTDTRCSATVTVPGLTIVKTADVATTTPGSVVRFTIVITNTGQTAYPTATLTDGIAGVLDDASYNNNSTATSGNVSYTSPSLTWTGSLAVGASVTITYSVTVADPDNGDRSLTGTVVSPSAGSPCPSGNPAAQCTATVQVLVPALSITNSADVTTTTPGGTVAYTVTLANTGQTPYTATSVTVALAGALDDATYNGNASASAGNVTYNAGTSSLVWTGDLAVGATVAVTASLTVRNPDPGDKTMTTFATSPAKGSTCLTGGSSPACTTTVQVRVPGLTITTSANVSTTTPGSVVRYTVSATNTGQTAYTAAELSASLTGVLDDATYNSDVAATAGAASVTGSVLTWSDALLIGATATITYSVTVHDPDQGNLNLSTTVSSTTAGNNCPSGGADPRCASSIAVLVPGLTITGTISPTTATPNEIVRYSGTVTNTGQTPYLGLSVTLDLVGTLDDADYNYDATITTGDLVTHADGTVSWVLDLAPGASASGTLTMTVKDPATGDRSLRVIAVSDAPGSNCPTGSADPACHETATILIPGLTVTKTANTSTVSPGGTVGYTITVVNNGETTYPDAQVTDDLTRVLTNASYPGDAIATSGAVTYTAPVLAWQGALAPGASATIAYTVTVFDPDTGDKLLINTAVSPAAGSNCATGSTDARCTATVNVLVPLLTIAATANTSTTTPGATVTYTIKATNAGATAFTGATVTNSLAGVLDDAGYNADASATTGTVGFTGSALTWTGDLAIGAVATITYSVTVHAADSGDDLVTATVTSTTSGNNCVAGNGDARCVATVAVARLILWQRAEETTATPGSAVHLTATYTNTGQVPYSGISVVSPRADTSDDTITGDETTTSGTLAQTAEAITWTGNIPVGATITVLRTLTVKNPDPGNKLITATLEATAPGNNCQAATTDSRCTFAVTVLVPQLTITKAANTPATVPGGTVTYTITAHNTGQTAYTAATFTDPLSGVLDDAIYNGNATTTIGSVTYSSSTLAWNGDLAIGASAVITYSVTARSPATADKTMVNVVSSTTVGNTCPAGSGNPECRRTVVVLTPALTIVKTSGLANATLGTTVTYTVAVRNSGQTSHPAAAFTDPLADVLDDATYNPAATTATSGTVSYTNGVLSWSGALAPTATATITYTVTINNPSTGDRTMANTVTSATTGNNCATGSTDTRCTATVAITNEVSLTFTKTANRTATVAGGVVTYTVTVNNATDSPVAANVTDPLAGIVDDATYNGDAAADGGTVSYTDSNLTWTGDVPATSTVTMTYSVTVHGTVTGNQILLGTISSDSLPASNNCLANSDDPRCTNTVPVASLLIVQQYAVTSTTPGALVRLNASFTNTGQLPYTGITISSPSADTVDDAIPTGDQVATSGTLILSSTAITWTGDIPVGGVVTVTGTLTVKNTELGNKVLTGTLVSTALGNNCPPGGTDTRCVSYLPVLVPALTISKSANTSSVILGGTAEFTVMVVNSGETPYTGATVTDTLTGVLDDATYNADAEATGGAVSFASPTLTWTGDLAVGATVTITYSVTARDPATGDKTMVNLISSGAAGNSCPPATGNTACRATVTVLTPLLTISSTASAATTVPGAIVSYTLTVTNAGQTDYPSASVSVPLAGVLDDATYDGNASATSGAVTLIGQSLTWAGALGQGATATITYTVTVDQPVTGDFRLTQTVTSTEQGSTCPAPGTDPRCTTSLPIASLRIINTADVATTKPTSVVHYTATFTNTGQVPYADISISDSVAGALDDATYNGDAAATAGSLILVTGTGRIVWTGDLPVGMAVTITGSLTVNNPDLGNKNLGTLVTTDAAASNCPTAAPGPDCATSVTVLIPHLTIGKTADTTTTTPGSTVGYTITVTNSGQTAYLAATVRDSLAGVMADATYNADAVATRGSVSFTSPTLTWTGDLSTGQTVVIGYSVHVADPALGGKLMANKVTSDELGSDCPTGGSAPSCATLVTVLVPALDIVITADRTTTVPGGTVGYTLTVRNTGQTNYPSASVTAHLAGALDDAAYLGGATATTGTVGFATPELSWTGALVVGATATVSYGVTVADPANGNRELVTTVTSPAPGSTCGTAPQCGNTVTVLIPGLAVSTSADVATATPGDRVVLTITVSNTGQTPYTGTVVSTTLTDVLDDAEFDGEITASIGVANYTAPELSWTGTLAVGTTATIGYAITIRSPDPGDKVLSTTVVADAAGSSCQDDDANPACTATVTVLVPSLIIGKSASTATTTPGAVVGYTITVANSGQTAYEGAVVEDSLAGLLTDADYNGDALATNGTLAYADSTLTWTGDLLIGANTTITYSVTVHDPDDGAKQMINTVSSAAPGSTCPPGNARPECSTLTRVLVPELVITKTADTTTVVAGDAVRYTVRLTNSGETDYAPAGFTDPLTGVLDDGDYAGDAVASTGTVEYLGDTLVWTGALDVDATATITYSVTTRHPATGDLTLANTVYSTSPGANCDTGTDALCSSMVTVLVPALTIAKTADTSQVVAGGTVQYTVSATNTGQSGYPVATLADSLAGVLDNAAYNADATATTGTVGYADGTLSWTGALPVGATMLLTYSVTVAVTAPDAAVLTNRVVSASVGSTCATGESDPGCATSTTIAARTITFGGLTPSFTLTGPPGSTVSSDGTVTMTVTTNSTGGYLVTVQSATTSLTGVTPGNSASIPIGQLGVRESGMPAFLPLSADTPVVVHQQSAPSAPGGDAVSNDYQIEIPDISSDTYTATLDYIVSAR